MAHRDVTVGCRMKYIRTKERKLVYNIASLDIEKSIALVSLIDLFKHINELLVLFMIFARGEIVVRGEIADKDHLLAGGKHTFVSQHGCSTGFCAKKWLRCFDQ